MYPVISLSPSIQIPVFYLVVSLAVCICLVWLNKRTKQQKLNPKIALDTALLIMISSLIGARFFHVVYESPEIYSGNPWAILYIWNGGFVFYGGALLAVLVGTLFVSTRARSDIPRYFDLFAPVGSLAYALGRWGCFFAGCCYGKYCDLPWAVAGRHPTQLYASTWEIGSILLLLGFEKYPQRRPGQVFLIWMVLHSCGRLLMESLRDDFRGPAVGFSISSWISLCILATGIFGLLRTRRVFLEKP